MNFSWNKEQCNNNRRHENNTNINVVSKHKITETRIECQKKSDNQIELKR